MDSTSATAQRLMGTSYTPSTSLALAASTSRFSLPPDFETMRSIRCVTAGYEYMEFEMKDLAHRNFQEYLRVPTSYTATPGGRAYYDIIGERTLFIVPQLASAVDIEIIYIARTYPLHRYQGAGTAAVTDAATSVAGVSTVWSSGTPFNPPYVDIVFGIASPSTLTNVDISAIYDGGSRNRVASIESDTALTLAAAKVATVAASANVVVTSVPVLPPEHHAALADFVTAQMFAKSGNQGQFERFTQKYEARKATILNNINIRQPDSEFVEEYSTWN